MLAAARPPHTEWWETHSTEDAFSFSQNFMHPAVHVVVEGLADVYVLPIVVFLSLEQVGTCDVFRMLNPLLQPGWTRGSKHVKFTVPAFAPTVIRGICDIMHDVHPDGVAAGGSHQAILYILIELVGGLHDV